MLGTLTMHPHNYESALLSLVMSKLLA